MTKFKLFFISIALLITSNMLYAQKIGAKFVQGDLKYTIISDSEVNVGAASGKITSATIPSTVEHNMKSYSVTSIRDKAFYLCFKLTSVTIPSSITSIGKSSFERCGNLQSISIPPSVTSIGTFAFLYCSKLTSITIPESVKLIESYAFANCVNIATLDILSPEIAIQNCAFGNCKNLHIVKIFSDKVNLTAGSFDANKTKAQNEKLGWCNISEMHVKQAVKPYVMGIASNPEIILLDAPQINTPPTNYIAVAPIATPQLAETPRIISDVDQNIPQTTLKSDKTFAVIIANEKYTTESIVDFALNDGKIFKEYCEKTLGIPSENIRFVENGTLGSIGAGIGWLKKVLDVYKQDANAIFYYSGHGIPNEANGDAYILPTDCQGSDFQYAYSINRLYKELGDAGANSVTYFIDACFSGTQRKGEMMVAARGVAIKAKSGVLSGNSVAFAAASGDETAFAYEEKGHGMFTYFLLKKLQETKGEVSYGELANYIQQNVKQKSIVVSPRLQSPNAISSTTASEGWQSWKLTK